MSVKQISVFLENRPGALCEMTRVLGENAIDMRAFSLAETSDFGIARVIVDEVYKTTTVLKEAGFINSVSSVLAVAIPDVPGGLSGVLKVLKEAEVNVEYIYAFVGGRKDSAYMILKVADDAKAEQAMRIAGVRLVEQEELSEL
ncbi:MAG: acetolactate synthase [Clostridia bacterium]|nr:acetolactate synthase [Clostridia bacterium]